MVHVSAALPVQTLRSNMEMASEFSYLQHPRLFAGGVSLKKELKNEGVSFLGCGVSGGETGALKGPSLMVGGDKNAYEIVAPVLEAIAGKDKNNNPCCTLVGDEGSGHFVKMIHNGIN